MVRGFHGHSEQFPSFGFRDNLLSYHCVKQGDQFNVRADTEVVILPSGYVIKRGDLCCTFLRFVGRDCLGSGDEVRARL